jgi:glycosyltransferase involved in cell wall biosynthesis
MPQPLKFCMITTFYPPYNFGGDGIYIRRLTHELADRGHRVDVVHCEDAYRLFQRKKVASEETNPPNVRVFRLKSRAGFLSPLLTYLTGVPFLKRKKIKELIGKNDYDVIHFHNMSLIGITALRLGKALKLYTMHEHWLVCPMHVLWKFNRKACQKRQCLLCTLAAGRPPQFWRYFGLRDRMSPHVDGFVSPSRFTRGKHHELGFDVPIAHLPYFLPLDKADKNQTSDRADLAPRRPYFLFVGRLEKIKGLQDLIPVIKEHPEYELLIAGEGTYGRVLRRLAGNAPNIQFLGKISHDGLRRLYREAIAVIVPSICYEVFGIIIIESFAVKTPVIVRNFGAMPEVIEDSGGGFVYKDNDELVIAMRTLATNALLRDELGARGYQAYLKYWSGDSHIEQYFNLINKLQSRKAGSRPQAH